MDRFTFKKRKQELSEDDYTIQLDKRLKAMENDEIFGAQKRELFESESLTKEEMKKMYVLNRSSINKIMYTHLFVSIFGNIFMYRRSVRFARKVLKIEGFWPINLACFVPITIFNFSVYGLFEGMINGLGDIDEIFARMVEAVS